MNLLTVDQFSQLMDPSYVIVDFGGAGVPPCYCEWLDKINEGIGGSVVGAAGPHKFNVTAGGKQPIMFMDPKLNNLNLLHINSACNANYVADQLKILGGLSAWVLETEVAPKYR
jgi:hypothetical protein